jgi:hypothetical protein
MYDIVFYNSKPLTSERKTFLTEKYPFAKFIEFNSTLTITADLAKKNIFTKFFWLIDSSYDFLDTMLAFETKKWDGEFVHIFKLYQEYADKYQCYLISKTHQIDTSQEFFTNLKYINNYVVQQDITYDIFFLSYNEPNSWNNWQILSNRFPQAKRVYGEKNIYLSHKACAEQSTTDYFWVVDADNEVLDSFNFDYYVEDYAFDLVHIWHSRNEINDLEYGNGAVKLLPKMLFDVTKDGIDITTSLSNKLKIIPTVASINRFASSPWNAWRSGFREAAKLASNVIARSDQDETTTRLTAWTTKGLDRPFGEYVIPGAVLGMQYGIENKENQDALIKINDWSWLYEQFKLNVKLPLRPE